MDAIAASDDALIEPELFGTETMAELHARQGRVADALRIYRRLLAGDVLDPRRPRWSERLAVLERARARAAGSERLATPTAAAAPPLPVEPHRLPVVVSEPVRAGQIIYAERNDLIVLAPVNPGAELVADGNIHVYAPLRGRAHAGAGGCQEARIFCQRLDAELAAIAGHYLPAGDIPPELQGRAVQVYLRAGGCVVTRL